MTANASSSPDSLQLRKKPLVGPRMGKRAGGIAFAVVLAGFIIVIIGTESRKAQNAEKPALANSQADIKLAPAAAGAEALTRGVSDELVASTAPVMNLGVPDLELAVPAAPQAAETAVPASFMVPDLSGSGAGAPQLDVSEGERRLQEDRERLLADAMKAGSKVQAWTSSSSDAGGNSAAGTIAGSAPIVPGLADLEAMSKQMAAMANGLPGQQQPDDQAKKKEFLAESQQLPQPYLASQRQAPRSAFELKTGTVIPGVMISGINSDLPGEVSAMVTDNVYDTATGRHLLVPAWTKIFGKYDSDVAYGQARALVVWTRLIYPDGSTLELGGMQGGDMAGYAGFRDKVDNHYARLIGFSTLSSVMAAGLQLSQPQEDSANGQLTNRQIVAGEVGKELSQLGVELTRRNLNVQPTIKIRNGYKFTITVNRDVAFASSYVTK
jgi:type IV secretory pathway VirB10-like protein